MKILGCHSYAVGGFEISLGYQELLGIGRVLLEIRIGFLQDCSTPDSSDKERGGFPVEPWGPVTSKFD